MTRWVKWGGDSSWHAISGSTMFYDGWFVSGLCGANSDAHDFDVTFSDFDPVEDECRLCRRAIDQAKP